MKFIACLSLLVSIIFLTASLPALAQESGTNASELILGDDLLWDQVPLETEQQTGLGFLDGSGMILVILYILGISFSAYSVHRSGRNNLLSPEFITIIYLLWFIFIPYTLFILFSPPKDDPA